ncbi:MAG: tetratricopeptide repeat protein [Candidatus Melainabacteria bacterium]|nr:tetratricopeptide repeat protein [Candidatus Melainabacteria bacterium]
MNMWLAYLLLASAHVVFMASNPLQPSLLWQKLNSTGEVARHDGKYAEAEVSLQAAINQAKQLGQNDPRLAVSLYNLGSLYQAQAKFREAKPLIQQALTIREKTLGRKSIETARTLNTLANLYRAEGKFAEAEPLYKDGLAIAEAVLGPGHPDLAFYRIPSMPEIASDPNNMHNLTVSLNNLADLYRAQDRYAEAEALYRQALVNAEKSLDSGHHAMIITLNNLGDLSTDQGKADEAEHFYEQALALTLKVPATSTQDPGALSKSNEELLTQASPDKATSLNNLADLKRSQGKLSEAEKLYKAALAADEKSLGPEHPALAITLNNLADLYAAQDNQRQANLLYQRAVQIREKSLASNKRDLATYQQALKIDEKILGAWHQDIAIDLNNLADLYRAQGNFAEAEALYRRALAISQTALGPDNPKVVQSLNNLADIYRAQGKYLEAEPLYKRAVATTQTLTQSSFAEPASSAQAQSVETLMLKQLGIATHLNNLADLLRAQGKCSEAEPLYWRAIVISEKAGGYGTPALVVALNNLADLYRARGRNAEAEPLYKRALALVQSSGTGTSAIMPWAIAIESETLGPDSANTAVHLRDLANIYLKERKYAQAELLYKEALAIQEKLLGPYHLETGTTLQHYAKLLKAAKRTAELSLIEARLKKIPAVTR